MSDEGDKICPLCAEEMDLTDQQLKPCKCGYEICVWCWHHIMDMAEKDETEGRCPACRTPYNKERIVGMAADCGKLVAEMSVEKKKTQKGRSKTSEGRKQLGSVRVIQRNLVYIVGLPLNLADEDLLQRKEYFGQYGKVQKVSISRTAAGAIQQFANSTCSVYITYSKEDEAVRCIQAAHGFVLEGRPLRACFGTTKYCHAWLRNVPCSNPDCLYLHEIGSQEDSFTKDEIISAYTRSRVQQITGATNSMQHRSGNFLPPPADEYCNNSSASTGKLICNSPTNNSSGNAKGSPPNSSSGRSVGLPAGALWGTRTANNHPPSVSLASSNGPLKQKQDTCNGPVTFLAAVANQNQASANQSELGKKHLLNGEISAVRDKSRLETLGSVKKNPDVDQRSINSEATVTVGPPVSSSVNSQLPSASKDNERRASSLKNSTISIDSLKSSGPGSQNNLNDIGERNLQNLCSNFSSNIDEQEGLQEEYKDQSREFITSHSTKKTAVSMGDIPVRNEESDPGLHSGSPELQAVSHEIEDDVAAFNNQRHKDPEVVTDKNYLQNLSQSFNLSNCSSDNLLSHNAADSLGVSGDFQSVDSKADAMVKALGVPGMSNGYSEDQVKRYDALGYSVEHLSLNDDNKRNMESFEGVSGARYAAEDSGESSIISNILSLDFDPWDEPLTSPQNFAKMLGENDNQEGSVVSSSRRVHGSNQSRFSFAREDEPLSQAPNMEPSLSFIGSTTQSSCFTNDFTKDRNFQFDKFGTHNGFSLVNAEDSDSLAGIHSYSSSIKLSGSRSHISAPPGFSAPNRAPPPGFTSQERVEPSFDPFSGNHLLDTSSLLRNQYQSSAAGNVVSNGDIEFMDPAILAVGKGRFPVGLNSSGLDMRSSFSPQYSSYENEARLQLLMERSLPPQQNQRYTDMGNSFAHLQDAYGISSRVMDHTFNNNLSPFSQLNFPNSRTAVSTNGHWDSWNGAHSGNDLAMAELLRNERLGFNKFYAGYEESKFRMPSSGDIYNRTYGI